MHRDGWPSAFLAALSLLHLTPAACLAQASTTETASQPALPADTRVILRLRQNVYKKEASPGERIAFVVVFDVIVNGQVLIPHGAPVQGILRGQAPGRKESEKVLIDLSPIQTQTGETVRLVGLRRANNRSDVSADISAGGDTGALAPIFIPAFVNADLLHRNKFLLQKDTCAIAVTAEDVALDPAKISVLPRDHYGASSRDRLSAAMSPCNFPRVRPISEYQTNMQSNPNNVDDRIGLVEALEDSGNANEAFVEVKKALGIWPDDPYLHYLLGLVLVMKNEPDAAILELQLALKRTNNHLSPADCALGRALELKGDFEQAFRQYHVAYTAHVNDENCRADYQRLKLQLKK